VPQPVPLDMQVADEVKDTVAPRVGGREFRAYLREWVTADRKLSTSAASALTLACEHLLRDKAARTRQPLYKYRVALYVLLSGDRRAAEQLLRVRAADMQCLRPNKSLC